MNYCFIFLTFLLSSYRGRKVFNIDFTFYMNKLTIISINLIPMNGAITPPKP